LNELILSHEKLSDLATQYHEKYISAKPFPHITIDNFLSLHILDKIIEEFPPYDAKLDWRRNLSKTDNAKVAQINKLGFNDERKLKNHLRQLFWELNSSEFLKFLEKLTGIQNLISDPHMVGGGIHQSLPGAILRVHADFNIHPLFNLDRRLNFLLFLNKDWKEEYCGDIELWSEDMKNCEHRIAPIANRCVIFNTSEKSFHGHPHPLKCPEGMTRKSVAMYYYSNGRSDENISSHSTLWQSLPHEK